MTSEFLYSLAVCLAFVLGWLTRGAVLLAPLGRDKGSATTFPHGWVGPGRRRNWG
jgi:hypothetical protein